MNTSKTARLSRRIIGVIAVACIATQSAIAQKVYWSHDPHDPSSPGLIFQRANLDGSDPEILGNTIGEMRSFSVASGHTKFYTVDNRADRIYRANIDGTGCASLFLASEEEIGGGVRVDIKGSKVYWLSNAQFTADSLIQRADLDGNNVETIVVETDNSPTISGLFLDADGGKIYWAMAVRDANQDLEYLIRRANLDGTEIEEILPGVISAVATGISDFEIDVVAQSLYWTHRGGDGHLFRVGLDGGPVEILIPNANASWIAVDHDNNALYWAVSLNETNALRRSTLDGTETVDLMPLPNQTSWLAFDLQGTTTLPPECSGPYDRNHDGDIDLIDFGAFQACFTGQRK